MPAAEDDKDNDLEISMRALKGGNSQSTMKSFGQINDKQVMVLMRQVVHINSSVQK